MMTILDVQVSRALHINADECHSARINRLEKPAQPQYIVVV
jgi:hypothetical protein